MTFMAVLESTLSWSTAQVRAPEKPFWGAHVPRIFSLASAWRLGPRGFEIPDPQQVKCCQTEDEYPTHARRTPVTRLPQGSHCLHPAKDLLNQLSLPLTELVSLVPSGAAVNRTAAMALVLGQMRCDPHLSQRRHEAPRVEALVPSHRQPPRCLLLAARTISSAASRSAVPVACVSRASTTSPLRFSIRTCPR